MTNYDSNNGFVREAVNTYIKTKERIWAHDRTMTVGASEIGQCARKTWFTKAEQTELASTFKRNPDYVDGWGARERGNLIEKHLLVPAIIHQYGKQAKLLGKKQVTFVDGFISATPDCLIVPKEPYPQFLIEGKSIDPRVNLEESKPENVFQAQVQMGILHAKTDWRPQYAILAYVNASFMDEITEFRIDYDPDVYERAKVRATNIMTASSLHELQPEGWVSGGKECEYCPFTDACGRARKEVPSEVIEPADAQFIAEISDMARHYKEVESDLASLEEMRRGLQNEIKERLREKGQSKIVGDGVSVSWTQVKGRETFDMAAIAEAYTKLYNAVHDAFMAMCAYRDNPDKEVFQDAIDSLGIAPISADINKFKREGVPGDRLTVTLKPATLADKAKVA